MSICSFFFFLKSVKTNLTFVKYFSFIHQFIHESNNITQAIAFKNHVVIRKESVLTPSAKPGDVA